MSVLLSSGIDIVAAPRLYEGLQRTVSPREYARHGPHEQVERDADAESRRLVPLLRRPVVAQPLCPIGTRDIAARAARRGYQGPIFVPGGVGCSDAASFLGGSVMSRAGGMKPPRENPSPLGISRTAKPRSHLPRRRSQDSARRISMIRCSQSQPGKSSLSDSRPESFA